MSYLLQKMNNKLMQDSQPLKQTINAMKKLTTTVSPFLVMLVPVFLGLAFMATRVDNETPAEKEQASINLKVPAVLALVKSH